MPLRGSSKPSQHSIKRSKTTSRAANHPRPGRIHLVQNCKIRPKAPKNFKCDSPVRSLQRKLYCKAKAEPAFRFYVLYDKICREDILHHAYRMARANAGAPGVDGVTFAQIEEQGLEAWLAGLREELVSKTYRPDPVRRVMIPKHGGGERPLGIPSIRDRVIQTAAKIVLEPIFEADFEDNAYGYRPARGAVDAVKDVHRHLSRGYTDVVDADLSRYFDSIPHSELLKSAACCGWRCVAADKVVAKGADRGTGS